MLSRNPEQHKHRQVMFGLLLKVAVVDKHAGLRFKRNIFNEAVRQ